MTPRDADARQALLLERLAAAADSHAPCPRNEELLGLLGLASAPSVSYLFARLVRQELIEVESRSNTRRVTILATGRVTDWSGGRAPAGASARTHAAAAAAVDRLAEKAALAERIERDQAALRARRVAWLEEERRRYNLPRRARLIDEMPA